MYVEQGTFTVLSPKGGIERKSQKFYLKLSSKISGKRKSTVLCRFVMDSEKKKSVFNLWNQSWKDFCKPNSISVDAKASKKHPQSTVKIEK